MTLSLDILGLAGEVVVESISSATFLLLHAMQAGAVNRFFSSSFNSLFSA